MRVHVWGFFLKKIIQNNLLLKQFAFFSASYKMVKLDRSVSLVPSAMLLFMFTTWQGNV